MTLCATKQNLNCIEKLFVSALMQYDNMTLTWHWQKKFPCVPTSNNVKTKNLLCYSWPPLL
jgi:hypothetical protein